MSDDKDNMWNKENEEFFQKMHAETLATLAASPDEADRAFGDWMAKTELETVMMEALLSRRLKPAQIVALMARQFSTNIRFVCQNVTQGETLQLKVMLSVLKMLGGDHVHMVNVDDDSDDDESVPSIPGAFPFPPTSGKPN